MNFWKYQIIGVPRSKSVALSEIGKSKAFSIDPKDYLRPEVFYNECGFETEEEAIQDAKDIINTSGHDWDLSDGFEIRTAQQWQELEYPDPTQVTFFDSDLQECHAGIAYGKEVICGECGSVFELGEVEILAELNWSDLESDTISIHQMLLINEYMIEED